jgi:hypothetical protein
MKQLATLILIASSFSCFAQDFVKSSICIFDLSQPGAGGLESWCKVESVNVYGGGALLNLVTSEDDTKDKTSSSGSVGANFATKRLSCNLFFSYNGRQTVEVNTLSSFGNSLMDPNLGGQSMSFSVLGKIYKGFGFSCSSQVADNLWKTDSLTTIDASPMITRLGFYFKPFEFSIANNNIDFTLAAHYTNRSILGNFNNNDQIIEEQVIKPRGYNGFDFSANFFFNSVQLFFRLSANAEGDVQIPGFTGSQVTFGVNVTGQLIQLK